MAAYKYYAMERNELKVEYSTVLTCQETEYIFARLKTKYKLDRYELRWRNMRRTQGICAWNGWITLSPPTNVGVLAHEVAHAIRRTKRIQVRHKTGLFTKEKAHNKKHFNAMRRVAKVILNNLSAWKAACQAQIAQKNETAQRREEKAKQFKDMKTTPAFKLGKLRLAEKAWLRKHKLATTKLKQIQRKINIWQRKQDVVEPIPQEWIDPSEARMKAADEAWNAVGT